jgi:tetratricopeptide (TPR) repeat protein
MRNLGFVFLAALILLACGKSGQQTQAASASAPAAGSTPAAPAAGMVPSTAQQWASGAQLFDQLGNYHRKITTSSEQAQTYFDQGMRLLWAFNHDESTRSLAKAAQLDDACALCWWGVALTVGPNYNLPFMAQARAKVAWEALQQAQRAAPQAAPVEQALIAALSKRYQGPQVLDPSNEGPTLTAYADAMREVAKRFPDDLDVQVLFAEAMMNTHAWKLWTLDGKPAPGTPEIQATLESVLEREPHHPGANHYYIHAMEASPHPELALASAERLGAMMPAAGHLVHMPAHILQRVGRYADAAAANRGGAEADRVYLGKTQPPDYYGLYVAHNYQFLAYSTAMQGRKADTLDSVRHVRDAMPDELLMAMPGMDWYAAEQYAVLDRFGLWDQILAAPAPNSKLTGLTGGYLYAKASALAEKGRPGDAKAVLAQLEQLAVQTPAGAPAGLNTAKDLFGVATLVARARIARAERKTDEAIIAFEQAVAKEDQLAYDEPADWFVPVRHLLGAELLRAGRARQAEAVYREDLRRHPDNGWALYGLAQALKAQKRQSDAAKAQARFKQAWKDADVSLTASAF